MNFKHLILFCSLDVITTIIALNVINAPMLYESNPLMFSWMQKYGFITSLIVSKMLGLIIYYCSINLLAYYGTIQKWAIDIKKASINISCVIFIGVVLNNIFWIAVSI